MSPLFGVRGFISGELLGRVKTTGHLVLNQRAILGVSINTGVAMVGYIGTRERTEFNAIGDIVNVVFRMQEYAPESDCGGGRRLSPRSSINILPNELGR